MKPGKNRSAGFKRVYSGSAETKQEIPPEQMSSGFETFHRSVKREKVLLVTVISVVVIAVLYYIIAHVLPELELW